MKISVVGLGRLGVPVAVCLATTGFDVRGVDVDADKVRRVNNADRVPYNSVEPGVSEMLRRAVTVGELSATTDHEIISETEATIIMVNTPETVANAYSLEYVISTLEGIAAAIKGKEAYHLIILSSTVMPGTTQGLVQQTLTALIGQPPGARWGLVYVPEFLAIGSAVANILNPQFVLIGADDDQAFLRAYDVYSQLTGDRNADHYVRTSLLNAELAKIALNTAHITKISLANHWARLCGEIPGADVDKVMDVVGRDARIGPALLIGSLGYGGPCFPRDARAFCQISDLYALPELLPQAVSRANALAVAYLEHIIPSSKNVAILGMAYKPGVSIAIESLGVALAGALVERKQARVRVQDYLALDDAYRYLQFHGPIIGYYQEPENALNAADVVVVAVDEPRYATLPKKIFEGKMVVDLWRIINPPEDCNYIAVGRG